MVPAQQRFDAEDLFGAQVHNRLVVQHELLPVDRVTKRGGQRQPLFGAAIAIGGVDRVPRAVALRHVHRDVGLLEQLVDRGGVRREARDPDASVDDQRAIAEEKRLLEILEDLARGQLRTRDVRDRQQHGELVAAEPRHGVGLPQCPPQSSGHLLQHAIARVMPQRVVDLLEPVEVEDEERQRLLFAPRGEKGLLQIDRAAASDSADR